jgi:hypothetical protein
MNRQMKPNAIRGILKPCQSDATKNETAFDALQEILRRDAERDGIPQKRTPKPEKLSYRVKAGRKGGLKGGKARAKKLSAKKKAKIAKQAARSRWANQKPE